jgi:hypothetical protein
VELGAWSLEQRSSELHEIAALRAPRSKLVELGVALELQARGARSLKLQLRARALVFGAFVTKFFYYKFIFGDKNLQESD